MVIYDMINAKEENTLKTLQKIKTASNTRKIKCAKVHEIVKKQRKEDLMANNTIFDDVFQTIKEKMPELTIPLINETFGTDYSLDTPVALSENEHHTVNGKLITDSHLLIGHNRYHLECQSTEDGSMDWQITFSQNQKISGKDWVKSWVVKCWN